MGTPAGLKMEDGYRTTIEFSENTTVSLWEKEVTPPGVDGGGEIDTTTMRNDEWRTKAAKALKTLTEGTVSAAYDPQVYDQIMAMVNVNQAITVTLPDGSTVVFWGWLNSFKPGALVEGQMPLAEVQIIPSNVDGDGAEIGPVYTGP